MTTYQKTSLAYAEIIKVAEKHKDVCVYDMGEILKKSKHHLFGIELNEKYGLELNPRDILSLDYQSFGEHRAIGNWGEKYRRTVSWSDDGIQPEDETLLVLSFSTGAYIFGEDYPEGLFKRFFLELKGYGPKYTDSMNQSLYFSLENAGPVFNEFNKLFKKYHEEYKNGFKERQIAKLTKELALLTP